MNKKIIGIINPFDVYQTFYVYIDKEMKDFESVQMDYIPETVLALSRQYEINEITLTGDSKDFLQKIAKNIETEEINKYNESVLKINII